MTRTTCPAGFGHLFPPPFLLSILFTTTTILACLLRRCMCTTVVLLIRINHREHMTKSATTSTTASQITHEEHLEGQNYIYSNSIPIFIPIFTAIPLFCFYGIPYSKERGLRDCVSLSVTIETNWVDHMQEDMQLRGCPTHRHSLHAYPTPAGVAIETTITQMTTPIAIILSRSQLLCCCLAQLLFLIQYCYLFNIHIATASRMATGLLPVSKYCSDQWGYLARRSPVAFRRTSTTTAENLFLLFIILLAESRLSTVGFSLCKSRNYL